MVISEKHTRRWTKGERWFGHLVGIVACGALIKPLLMPPHGIEMPLLAYVIFGGMAAVIVCWEIMEFFRG